MRHYLILGLLTVAFNVYGESVSLRGGSKIDAAVIKDSSETLVLDLGFDLLRVPRSQILNVEKDAAVDSTEDMDTENGFFTEGMQARISTAQAVSKYGSSVVLVKTAAGLGSGFFVNKEGYLITNFHVIQGEKKATVTQFAKEGTVLRRIIYKDIEIVAVAPFYDLAILKVSNLQRDVNPVVFAPGDGVNMGDTVFAVGNPLGLERSVTEGVVSQPYRNFAGFLYIQVDAPVNPGNSGGPLFNNRGQVIGVINMGIPSMEGLNFAIPAVHAKYMLRHIDAFAYDASNPESGYVYPDPPRRPGYLKGKIKE